MLLEAQMSTEIIGSFSEKVHQPTSRALENANERTIRLKEINFCHESFYKYVDLAPN